VDLKEELSPTTIAALETYRDKCIEDCGLSGDKPGPEHHSMLNGLAVDAPILRFNKTALGKARHGIFGPCGALVQWGIAQRSPQQ
jgi:hypothetical protein